MLKQQIQNSFILLFVHVKFERKGEKVNKHNNVESIYLIYIHKYPKLRLLKKYNIVKTKIKR